MSLRTIFRRLALLPALLFGSGSAVLAQAPPAVPPPTGLPIHQQFLTSDNGWMAVGTGGKVSVAASPLTLNSVHGALQIDYSVSQGNMAFFALPVEAGALAQARKFRFAVRSDYPTTVAFALQEKDGGRYMSYFCRAERRLANRRADPI